MNIEHISVSRSKSYGQCHYYYKLKYHDKIPNPGVEQFYFTYGKVIHKIAETYVGERAARSLAEISTDVLRGKIEIEPGKKAPPLPADYKRRMPGHLASIQKLTTQIGTDGILEYPFKFDLDPPHEKRAVGFIDRLILKGKSAFILDYKTTKKGPYRVNKSTVASDLQLRSYARVIQRDFNIKPENISAALYYLEGGDLVATKFNEESLASAEAELLDYYNKIQAHDPAKAWGTTGQHCARCEYNKMCPFYSSKSNGYGGYGGKTPEWDGDMSKLFGG
jgi:RecB family exonuclease